MTVCVINCERVNQSASLQAFSIPCITSLINVLVWLSVVSGSLCSPRHRPPPRPHQSPCPALSETSRRGLGFCIHTFCAKPNDPVARLGSRMGALDREISVQKRSNVRPGSATALRPTHKLIDTKEPDGAPLSGEVFTTFLPRESHP